MLQERAYEEAKATETHCNTLQRIATHCKKGHTKKHKQLQPTATYCNPLQERAHTEAKQLQHTAAHCNTPHHTTTHRNSLQTTAGKST